MERNIMKCIAGIKLFLCISSHLVVNSGDASSIASRSGDGWAIVVIAYIVIEGADSEMKHTGADIFIFVYAR